MRWLSRLGQSFVASLFALVVLGVLRGTRQNEILAVLAAILSFVVFLSVFRWAFKRPEPETVHLESESEK
jgi:phosphotransferase system  glucose/maltose/N-acetylglucosamine-specific IIC component